MKAESFQKSTEQIYKRITKLHYIDNINTIQ